MMEHNAMSYYDAGTLDLIIVCSMVYLIIIPTCCISKLVGEDCLVLQIALFAAGSALNITAGILTLYHTYTARREFQMDRDGSSQTMGIALIISGTCMIADACLILRRKIKRSGENEM